MGFHFHDCVSCSNDWKTITQVGSINSSINLQRMSFTQVLTPKSPSAIIFFYFFVLNEALFPFSRFLPKSTQIHFLTRMYNWKLKSFVHFFSPLICPSAIFSTLTLSSVGTGGSKKSSYVWLVDVIRSPFSNGQDKFWGVKVEKNFASTTREKRLSNEPERNLHVSMVIEKKAWL